MEIVTLPSQYILSLLLFMIINKNQFPVNSEIRHIDTRQQANFHQPSVNVAKYQKGVYYSGVKVFNMLPSYTKTELDNPKKFKVVLQKFLYENSFYSLDEYFKLQKNKKNYTLLEQTYERLNMHTLTHCGQVTQICVFNTVKLGTSASSP